MDSSSKLMFFEWQKQAPMIIRENWQQHRIWETRENILSSEKLAEVVEMKSAIWVKAAYDNRFRKTILVSRKKEKKNKKDKKKIRTNSCQVLTISKLANNSYPLRTIFKRINERKTIVLENVLAIDLVESVLSFIWPIYHMQCIHIKFAARDTCSRIK